MNSVQPLLTLADLKIVLLNAKHPLAGEREWHDEAYRCWSETWSQTFGELPTGPRELRADSFSHQDEAGALFWRKRCIGVVLFNFYDLGLASAREESYFSRWNVPELVALAERGEIMVSNHLTLRPEYRHNFAGVSLKDVLMGMCALRYRDSTARLMLGSTRIDRKVNELSTRWGARVLRANVPSGYGDFVDQVLFMNLDWAAIAANPHFNFVQRLWKDKLEPRNKQGVLEDEPIKKAA